MLRFSSQWLDGLPTRELKADELLIEAGTRTGRLFFLKSGELAVLRQGVAITRVRDPGAVFGEMSLILDSPHTADVVAISPTVCHVVEDAAAFLLAKPELAAYLATILAHRLDAVTRYLVDVRAQFTEEGSHLGMLDEVVETVLVRHPRAMRG